MGVVVQNVLFPSRTDLLLFYCCHKKKSFYRFAFFYFVLCLQFFYFSLFALLAISFENVYFLENNLPKTTILSMESFFYCYTVASSISKKIIRKKKKKKFCFLFHFFAWQKKATPDKQLFFVLFLFKQKSLQRFWCG